MDRGGRRSSWRYAPGLACALLLAGCGTEGGSGLDDGPPGGGPDGLAPTLSAYLGGGGVDQLRDIAVDGEGHLYVAGGSASPDYPVTPEAFQTRHNPGTAAGGGIEPFDVTVTKLRPDGSVVWSTYVGGPNYDRAYAVEVDSDGFVYVAGRAGPGFPITSGAAQVEFRGGQEADFYGPQDGFICKLAPDGRSLVFCTYFGTPDPAIVRDIALAPDGSIYFAAARASGSYPAGVQQAFRNAPSGDVDGVVGKLSADGSRVLWAVHLGGSRWEGNENSVRVDGAGNPYVLLTTESPDARTTAGVPFPTHSGGRDLYVARLDPASGALRWATFLGGEGDELTETHELAVGADGSATVAARTSSRDLATTAGAVQPGYGGGESDVLVARFSPDGTQLVGLTYVGGEAAERAEGVALEPDGRVAFTGITTSADFPVTEDAFQRARAGSRDAIIVLLSPQLDRLEYSTFLGGAEEDLGRAATSRSGDWHFAGMSRSSNWPTVATARGHSGDFDGVVVSLPSR